MQHIEALGLRLHIGDRAARYVFSDTRQLMADFFEEIARWNHEHGYD